MTDKSPKHAAVVTSAVEMSGPPAPYPRADHPPADHQGTEHPGAEPAPAPNPNQPWLTTEAPDAPPPLTRPAVRARRPYRRPLLAFPAMIALGLLAAFFAWQAAEPLWLAMGRGVDGTATVTRCDTRDGQPVTEQPAAPTEPAPTTYSCVVFTEATGAFHAADVNLRAAGDAATTPGATTPARMLSAAHGSAYADHPTGLHLRWGLGLALVLACSAGVVWASGATRLEPRRIRLRAATWCLAGPLLLTVGFLAAAW